MEFKSIEIFTHYDQVEFILGVQGWFNILKPIYVIYHIKSKIEKSRDHISSWRKSV